MPTVAHLPALVIETDGTIHPEQIPVSSYWTGTTQKVRAEQHGRGAAFDAVRDTWALFHPIGDAPGIACMAVGANHQADKRQPVNETATAILTRYGTAPEAPLRGRAVILSGSDARPGPLFHGVAAVLTTHLQRELSEAVPTAAA
ncbi:hypothetical protein AAC389_29765 (plasmid) [Rhodococcus qingshengii]|uniref:hypothetical protein n=1 Tax=Rhodococcus qingshengii TaxID=334542 RepID=UPI00311CB2A5